MFINLKVLDSESEKFCAAEAVVMGYGFVVYNDRGHLSMIGEEEDYEKETKKMSEIFEDNPSIIDKMSEMAAQDYLELCE